MKRYDKRIRKGKEKCAKIICTFLCISFTSIACIACNKMETTDIPVAEAKVVKTETEPQYVHVICDVIFSYGDTVDDIYATNLVCKMPDGTLHVYQIEDAPEGKVELVCFRTTNQDDYSVYEVVAVR